MTDRPKAQEFIDLYERFQRLTPGQRHELRKAKSYGELTMMPSFYKLTKGLGTGSQWQRVVYLLPYITHHAGGDTLGAKLAGKKKDRAQVSEQRLFQVIRSEPPNDLNQLRRLVQQVEPVLDWPKLANTLFFWGTNKKRKLIEDYYLASTN